MFIPTSPNSTLLCEDGLAAIISSPDKSSLLNPNNNDAMEMKALDASKIKFLLTKAPRPIPDEATVASSNETITTDHMVAVAWSSRTGWSAPELRPYGPLSLMPTASCLHYATQCFEGLKAFRGYDGKLRVFRPDHNCNRMNMSAARVSLPEFEPRELQKLIATLLSTDGPRWLPKDRAGSFLYLRPTLIGTGAQIGIQTPKEAMLYIIAAFIPRLDCPRGGMRLLTSPPGIVRAWPGGFGYAKIGANYGPSLAAAGEACSQGYHQILWLYGENDACTEAGGSNFFVIWKRRDGRTEVITAPLDDDIILDGITRLSCLELLRQFLGHEIDVLERQYTISDLIIANAEGRVLECFVTGTAYFVCPVSQINHRGHVVNIPMGGEGRGGTITSQIKLWLSDIMYGHQKHEWGVEIPEKDDKTYV